MSNCGCVYVDNGDLMPEFYNSSKHRARKNHKCDECGKAINKRELYECVSGKWDGDFLTYKTCGSCLDIRTVFFCDGWIFTEVIEALENYIHDGNGVISEDCLSELKQESRENVCEMIEEYWRRYDNG